MSDARATVTITRTDPADAGHRQIIVTIDEGASVTLMAGESSTVDTIAGAHTLHANNTLFWKHLPFQIGPGEHLEFSVVNLASRLSFGFLAGLGMAPLYLRVSRKCDARRDR